MVGARVNENVPRLELSCRREIDRDPVTAAACSRQPGMWQRNPVSPVSAESGSRVVRLARVRNANPVSVENAILCLAPARMRGRFLIFIRRSGMRRTIEPGGELHANPSEWHWPGSLAKRRVTAIFGNKKTGYMSRIPKPGLGAFRDPGPSRSRPFETETFRDRDVSRPRPCEMPLAGSYRPEEIH